ncbi:MAG: NAD(P)-binding protein [Pseudomonadota bacterium]
MADGLPVADPLLRPGRIGNVLVPNRVVFPPMTTRLADADGFVTADTLAYYGLRARHGVGLVTVEMASPERCGRHRFNELGIDDDRFLPGLAELAALIHLHGAKAAIQLGHGGGHTREDISGEPPVAPSAIPHPVFERFDQTVVPEAMSVARIRACVDAFAAAAVRARRAGFDAVDVHAAHGYLISQFLCPVENRRDDAYGGSLENRARFAVEIIRAIKDAVPDLAVIFRQNGDDFVPGGMTAEEAVEVAVMAEAAGADAIHVTAGHYRSEPSPRIMIPPMHEGEGPFVRFARAVKARVTVPVIAVGRLGDPVRARAVLEEAAADFVALGRPLLADHEWVAKVRAGRTVRRCLGCNSCVDGMRAGDRLHCIVNPVTGRERAFTDTPPIQGERILVIGAGPAGLSYAALLAPGNHVVVIERTQTPGGSLHWAGRAPLYQNVPTEPAALEAYVASLTGAAVELGVEIRYGVDILREPEVVRRFDRVVIATGAAYRFGLGPPIRAALRLSSRAPGPWRRLLAHPALRALFYHRLRRPTGDEVRRRLAPHLAPGASIEVLGDAARPGKTGPAVLSAFRAAFASVPALDGDIAGA